MSINEKEITDDLFLPADSENGTEAISRPTITYWAEVWKRFRKNKAAFIGLILISIILALAIFGPYANEHGYDEQNLTRANLPPKIPILEQVSWLGVSGTDIQGIDRYKESGITEYFWFGTDNLGRDLWTRVWEGTRISLYIAILAALIDLIIGVVYGGISAYYGGRIDNIMQRIVEILVGIPSLIVVILLILVLQPGIISITLAMVITGWVGMARIVRGQILKLKEQEYVLASRTLGAKDRRLIWKHLIPNTMGPIIITTMFTIPTAIFTEAFLSFIGLGLQPPIASLGTLINDGYKLLRIYPHMLAFSSIIISLIMISFNLIGDGLRDALDPKMRK
ncbi:oligopeptide ABC transporter permease [Cytobacillus solani]|uniref:Peptide ABC transporter permease n=1 Tax=Cytobacillus solani TaxID=1637975 RepID=A0A0Q3QTS0_9BACI|nr:oligopeptide ABC transporter permease [Cytobacillus solani]KOP84155.1 peptide ABC transporter permease [Bacillus sp. FJAT-21945]KQL20952.1 peptide ABC transporter permease [Cytobacillus solani]USK54193.1 ABC transporter permease [Cytobacillus solani]